MKEFFIARMIPLGLTVAGAALLYTWVGGGSAVELAERLPGADNAPQVSEEDGNA